MWEDGTTREVRSLFLSFTIWCAIDPRRITLPANRATHKTAWKNQVSQWIYRAKPKERERQRIKGIATNAKKKAERLAEFQAQRPTSTCKFCGNTITLTMHGGSKQAYCNKSCKNKLYKLRLKQSVLVTEGDDP